MCTAGVALRALRFHAELQSGERVLITGATGGKRVQPVSVALLTGASAAGVGIHAIQLVKNVFKGTVVAVTSSHDKASVLRQYGADEVIVCSTKQELQRFHHK